MKKALLPLALKRMFLSIAMLILVVYLSACGHDSGQTVVPTQSINPIKTSNVAPLVCPEGSEIVYHNWSAYCQPTGPAQWN